MKPARFDRLPSLVPATLVLLSASAAAQKVASNPYFSTPLPELELQHVTPATPTAAGGGLHATDLRPRFDRVYHDTDANGVLWARGRAYKASFGAAGASYVPFFGSAAPRNFPVTFSLASAKFGSTDVAFAHGVDARREGDRITFDRGAIREVYDLSVEGVEQSFDLDRRDGDGDLTLRVAFESELDPVQRGRGLAFQNDHGRVDYSGAVAIDAGGRHIALETELDGGAVAITVPDAWLDTAAFPIRIDPTITTYAVVSTLDLEHRPDVSWDDTSVRMIVVWESNYSMADHDVGYACVFPNGTVSNTGWIDVTMDYWREPRVGHLTASLRQLVVATKGAPGAGTTQIWGRVVSADGNSLYTPQFQIDAGATGNGDQPDVGGDNTFDTSRPFCVVWREAFGGGATAIAVRRVLSDGTLVSVVGTVPTAPGIESNPRVSDTNDGTAWTIVYQRLAGVNDHDIFMSRPTIDFANAPTGAITTSTDDEIHPSVSSCLAGSTRFMAVWERRVGNNSNVDGILMNGPNGEGTTSISQNDGSIAADTVEPVVETDGKHYNVVYRDTAGNVLKVTEMFCIQSPLTLAVVAGQVQIFADVDVEAQLASYWSTGASVGANSRRSLAGVYSYAGNIKLAMMENKIGGDAFAGCFGDGSGTACPCGNNGATGHGCGNSVFAGGALLAASGNAGLGSEDSLTLLGSNMPANVACLYFQGTVLGAFGTNFGDGQVCAGGTVIRLGTKTNDPAGQSQYPTAGDPSISVRGMLPAGGGSRGYQVWYRNAATFCTASTFNLTNGMYVTFAP